MRSRTSGKRANERSKVQQAEMDDNFKAERRARAERHPGATQTTTRGQLLKIRLNDDVTNKYKFTRPRKNTASNLCDLV
jgi:uncharacterized protein (DUF4415 family)